MNILLFAGTSEGRALAEFLIGLCVPAQVCVASEYGQALLPQSALLTVHSGRLDEWQMRRRMDADTLVIDATHPYATEATRNICAACKGAGATYMRLLRPANAPTAPCVMVQSASAAADYLAGQTGTALLTTGSKELRAFTAAPRFAERFWVRVLPDPTVLAQCCALGFAPKHIIAMQGPFSVALNLALLQQIQAKFLVTKDTGAAGGFAEKCAAAKQAGATVVCIARPTGETGLPLAEIKRLLRARLGIAPEQILPAAPRFPLFVALAGKRAVVFGAGQVAARRIEVLKAFGAEVAVVSPEARADLAVTHLRGYQEGDLCGVFLAVAATDDRAVNARIARDCHDRDILCSVADSAAQSTFYFPAVCTGGGLTAGVVSQGTDHAAVARTAARIRRLLEEDSDEQH